MLASETGALVTMMCDGSKMITVVVAALLLLCQYNGGPQWQDGCGGGGFIVAVSYSIATVHISECCIMSLDNRQGGTNDARLEDGSWKLM